MKLRYSTKGRVDKSDDTERWVRPIDWRRTPPEITVTDTILKLGIPHPDGKVIRRQTVR